MREIKGREIKFRAWVVPEKRMWMPGGKLSSCKVGKIVVHEVE